MKTIEKDEVAIFLFSFNIVGDGIEFGMNEGIAEDMYEDIDQKLRPLIEASGETLLRYKQFSVGKKIMTGNILHSGHFEVMLSKGLGYYVDEEEKEHLFRDARRIQELLTEVMDRREDEASKGIENKQPFKRCNKKLDGGQKSMKELAQDKALETELINMMSGDKVRSGLIRMTPKDLPEGVFAERGYDHRGQCYAFYHDQIGALGKVTLVKMEDGRTLIQSDLYIGKTHGDPDIEKRKQVFSEAVAVIGKFADLNFGKDS